MRDALRASSSDRSSARSSSRRIATATGAALIAWNLFAAPAAAPAGVARTWVGPDSSNWNIDGNWSPTGIPQTDDDVVVRKTGSAIVRYPSTITSTVGNVTVDSAQATGTMTLQQTGGSLTATGFLIGQAFNGQAFNGRYQLDNGTLQVNRTFESSLSIAGGTHNVSFGGFTLNNGTLIASNTEVGLNGRGEFLQNNGLYRVDALVIGANNGSAGRYVLNSGKLAASSVEVGRFGGVGTLQINGGTFNAFVMTVGSSGTTPLSTTGGVTTLDTLNVGNRWDLSGGFTQARVLQVGNPRSGVVEQGAGAVNVTDSLMLGNAGAGTWHLADPDALLTTKTATIGGFLSGEFVQDAGTFSASNLLILGLVEAAPGTFTLNGGSVMSKSVRLGDSGAAAGTFLQAGGSNVVNTTLRIGGAGTGVGYYRMSGGTLSAGSINNSGILEISNGTITTGNIGSISASAGSIGITGGTLRAASIQQKQLTINGGQVLLNPTGTDTPVNRIEALAMSKSGGAYHGKLDLNDGDLIITATLASQLRDMLVKGRNNGAWTGNGVASRYAATHPAATLGMMTGSEYLSVAGAGATFDGATVAGSDVLIKCTYNGDTDFNGRVAFDDYVRTDNGFNNHLSGWTNGDFDFNSVVNFDDYVLIDLAYNAQSGTVGRALSFLEGSDTSSRGMDTPALRMIRQHSQEFGGQFGQAFIIAVPEPQILSILLLSGLPQVLGRRRRGH